MQFIIDLMLLCFYAFFTVAIFVYTRRFWMMYVNQKYMNKVQEETIMLEIKLPREIDKSPLAMEMVISNFTQGSGLGTWYVLGITGNLPLTFSLEIASLEGVIHFYIRTHKKFKELISSSIYAHYPGAEVVEVVDYTAIFPRYEHNKQTGFMWGNGFKLTKDFTVEKSEKPKKQTFLEKYVFFDEITKEEKEEKLPADIVPIRTYIDLGLDKNKEEMKVDPLVSILEYFGSLGKGEYAGFQIILQDEATHNGKKAAAIYHHPVSHEILSATKLAQTYKDFLRNKTIIKKGTPVEDDYGYAKPHSEGEGENKTTGPATYQKDVTKIDPETSLRIETKNIIELVERKMSKPLLACVMRTVYVIKPENKFNGNYVQNCLSLTKPFNAPGFNSLGPSTFANPYDFDWQNPKSIRSNWRAEEIFDAYVEREGFHPHTGLVKWLSSDAKGADADRYFYNYPGYMRRTITMIIEAILEPFGHPHADEVFVMNTEELATIFHLPGLVANVPTLPRIDSRKAVAPVNLPV